MSTLDSIVTSEQDMDNDSDFIFKLITEYYYCVPEDPEVNLVEEDGMDYESQKVSIEEFMRITGAKLDKDGLDGNESPDLNTIITESIYNWDKYSAYQKVSTILLILTNFPQIKFYINSRIEEN